MESTQRCYDRGAWIFPTDAALVFCGSKIVVNLDINNTSTSPVLVQFSNVREAKLHTSFKHIYYERLTSNFWLESKVTVDFMLFYISTYIIPEALYVSSYINLHEAVSCLHVFCKSPWMKSMSHK